MAYVLLKLTERMWHMERRRKYRLFLYTFLMISLLALAVCWIYLIWESVPSVIHIRAGEEQEINLQLPVSGKVYANNSDSMNKESEYEKGESSEEALAVISTAMIENSLDIDLGRPVTLYGEKLDNYAMKLKLFGMIPFKTVEVQVVEERELIPAGMPIGIYMKTDGILVIATGDFEGEDGQTKEPAGRLLQAGDYILEMDGEILTGKKQFIRKLSESEGKDIILTIRREDQVFEVALKPEKNISGEYKLGIWIRDNAQGVGTMTFIDGEDHYGALGHGINDADTADILKLKSGSLYKTEIISITRGVHGTPGELTGVIDYKECNLIGSIDENQIGGIFGKVNKEICAELSADALPVAYRQEVRTGPAQILCSLGDNPQYYDIEITDLHLDNDNVNRGIEVKVVDQGLLEITGGIVQGMSGSPIIQNGKIVGAVTHVLVNDPTRGYGIFIENMLEH